MKRTMLIVVIVFMLSLFGCNLVFAGSLHHNNINRGGNSSASAGAVGIGVGISKNTNKNTVVGVNKNFNANLNKNDIDVNNKVKNTVKVNNDLSNRVNTTDINLNKNEQDQKQGQLQAQSANNKQGQAQDASNKQGQATEVIIEDNSSSEDNSISWSQGSIGVEKGVNSIGLTHPLLGGLQAGSTESYAKIMENINTTIKLSEIGVYTPTEAKERIKNLMSKLDKKTLCNKKFLGIIKFGNPILDLFSFDVCQEL